MEQVRQSGAEILAEYPDSVLVRADDDQAEALGARLETAALPEPPVRTASAQFLFADALAANEAAPIEADPDRRSYFLVRLVGPAKQEWLDEVRGLGARIQGAVPGYGVIVGALPDVRNALEQAPYIEAVTPYRPAMRLAPTLRPDVEGMELATAELATVEQVPEEAAQVEVTVFDGESVEDVAGRIRASGGSVISTSDRHVVAHAPPEALQDLAAQNGIEAILPFAFPEPTNDQAAIVMDLPADNVVGTFHLTGAGQTVGVSDTGLDTGDAATVHADLAGRVTIVSSPNQSAASSTDPPPNDDGAEDEHGHGTHVAGSVAGNGAQAIADGLAFVPSGTAPEAQIHFTAIGQRVNWDPMSFPPGQVPRAYGLYGIPANLTNLFTPAYTAGARIHTNSWGASAATSFGTYNSNARGVDQFMFSNRDMLILFSAGNNGLDANNDSQIDADSIGPPGTAKNCLTVGASENNRPNGSTPTPGVNIQWTAGFQNRFVNFAGAGHVSDDPQGLALFSSRGPTDDGRIKPDVVAPGTNVLSTRTTTFDAAYAGLPGPDPLWGDAVNGYCWSGGTSMSTPLVAGVAALVRQHLVEQRGHVENGVKPSGALLKAFVVNGAERMTGQYPNEIPAGGQNNQNGFGLVNVTESLAPEPLGSTLFSDEPALAVVSGEMRAFTVRALDLARPLKVTLCWTDPPSPTGVGGLQNTLYLQVAPPGGGAPIDGDVTAFPTVSNNTQQVVIDPPVAGDYEIRVRGVNVVTTSAGAGAPAGVVQDFALVVSNAMGLSAHPVSVSQAIDTTGSMGSFGYMEPAKERAIQLADFLRAGDRLAVTEFSHRAAPPDGRAILPIRTLTTFSDWEAARSAVAPLTASGTTPIGAGLQEAWTQISSEAAGRPRGIVLLSDGFNNAAPDPATVLPSIPADVPIWAVALGPASLTAALSTIAASRPGGAYFSVASDQDVHHLHEIYAALQAAASGMGLLSLDTVAVGDDDAGVEVEVEPGLSELTFTTSWDAAGQEKVRIVAPDGTERGAGSPATEVIERDTHTIVRVGVPEPGRWTVDLRKVRRAKRCTVSTAAPSDLVLSARARPAKRGGILVTARLRHGAKPSDDARVRVSLLIPRRSVADVRKEHAARLKDLKLPKQVDEPGLSRTQRQALALSVLAADFREREGGIFERELVEIDLDPAGDGRFVATVPAKKEGDVRVDVHAHGEVDGAVWQRRATVGHRVVAPPPRKRVRVPPKA